LTKQHASYTLNDSQLPSDFHYTIQVSKEQLGLKILKDTIISVHKIDKLTPYNGDRMLLPNESEDTQHSQLTTVLKCLFQHLKVPLAELEWWSQFSMVSSKI